MVYKYLNSAKIDSENCSDWEPFFRVCMQQPRKEAEVFIPVNGELVLNQIALDKIETNTDWSLVRPKQTFPKGTFTHLSGLAKPVENGAPIFIIKDKNNTYYDNWLHYAPGHVIEGIALRIFDTYPQALKYATDRREECSVWQFTGDKFELLHDFSYQ